MIHIGSKGAKMPKVDYKKVVKKLKSVAPAAKPKTPTIEEVRQEISNLCVLIGDMQYGIRANAQVIANYETKIETHFSTIDTLRNKLSELEQAGAGSKGAQ